MGDNTKCYVVIGVVVAVIALIGILLGVSMKTLQSYEVALKYNTIQKSLGREPMYEGLHTGPPGFKFITFPNVFKTLSFSRIGCLNKDGVEIYLDVSYQYRPQARNLHKIVMQFRDEEGYQMVLESIGTSAIHDSCSTFNTSQFQAERGAFQTDVLSRVVDKSSAVHCDVTDLQINNIQRPGEYERAIRSKESAREEIEVAHNERPQQLTEAMTAKLQMETQYTIKINRAETDARVSLNQAQTKATAIQNDFQKEAETYRSLMDTVGMDVEGFLSYMGVRLLENAENPVYIGIDAPAKSSYLAGL